MEKIKKLGKYFGSITGQRILQSDRLKVMSPYVHFKRECCLLFSFSYGIKTTLI